MVSLEEWASGDRGNNVVDRTRLTHQLKRVRPRHVCEDGSGVCFSGVVATTTTTLKRGQA